MYAVKCGGVIYNSMKLKSRCVILLFIVSRCYCSPPSKKVPSKKVSVIYKYYEKILERWTKYVYMYVNSNHTFDKLFIEILYLLFIFFIYLPSIFEFLFTQDQRTCRSQQFYLNRNLQHENVPAAKRVNSHTRSQVE